MIYLCKESNNNNFSLSMKVRKVEHALASIKKVNNK